MEIKIAIVGTGNMSYNLTKAFTDNDIPLYAIYGRNLEEATQLAQQHQMECYSNIIDLARDSDVLILAINDDAIDDVLAQLPLVDTLLIHTSGFKEIGVFSERNFENYGVFYPLQSLSKNHPISFQDVPICLEASNEKVMQQLHVMAHKISNNVKDISSEERKVLHLAAVFANNFSNHMFTIADEILKKNKLSLDMLRPLILHTASKVQHNSPRTQQTGPAIRGDQDTQAAHLKLLQDEKHQEIYHQISQHIAELKNGDS